MDNIKEWISDNLRYILLGLALILVLVIAVLGIRAISSIAGGGNKTKTPQAQQTESETNHDVIVQDDTNQAQQSGTASTLTKNDAKVLTTMTAYYEARTNGDSATLRKLNPSMDDQEEANILNSYVESYSDISTYSMPGLTDGSYLVYVCYNGKVKEIDTLVPSLIEYYLMTDETGGLYIADTEGDAQVEAFCQQAQDTTEVQDLISSVNRELDAAKESDPALKEFMGQHSGTANEGGSQNGEESTESGEDESSEVVALDSCNVRSTPTTDEDNIIGSLFVGEKATKLGEEGEWVKIDYNGETAYVSSEFVASPEEAQAQEEASYYAPGAAE